MNNKIVIVQPGFAHYRNKLFELLSERHNIHVLYDNELNVYPGSVNPGDYSYSFLKNQVFFRPINYLLYLIEKKPDIVISSISTSYRSFVSLFYAICYKKKFILWIIEWREHSNPYSKTKNLLRLIKYLLGRILIKLCDALVVGGSASKDYAISLGKNKKDIFIAIQCANDLQMQYNIDTRKSKIISSDKFIFLYLSRIVPHKGLDILIHSFTKLRRVREDVCLIVCGDGPFRKDCERITISANTKDVYFLGSINPQNVGSIFKKTDVFVFPCHFDDSVYESWGLVINEAMSMGVPVITTRAVGATYDLIVNEINGLIVNPNQINSLYEAMEKILSIDLEIMKKNARSTFEKINSFENMADGFTDAINHVKKGFL